MAYDILQSSTQSPLLFFMVQSSDHLTGLTGASPAVTISKAGAAFASPSGAVTEISSGWYKVAGNATDSNTLGPLALHATAASGDPCDILVANIVAYDPQNATSLGLSRIDATISSRSTYSGGAVASVTAAVTVGTNNDKTGYSTNDWTTQLTESYSAIHVVPTPAQAIFEIRSLLAEASASGTVLTGKKIDGSTTAETFTLNSATSPTSVTRAT